MNIFIQHFNRDDELTLTEDKEFLSINACLHYFLNKIDLEYNTAIEISSDEEQIRIPEDEYECLIDEITTMLFTDSIEDVDPNILKQEPSFSKNHYWSNCKCYIFSFKVFDIKIKIKYGGYDGEEEHDRRIRIVEYKHPFVKDFIGCSENWYWKEQGYDKKIRQYQNIDKVIVTQL